MEENIKNNTPDNEQAQAGKSLFNFQTVYMTLILNWKWFVLSLIICLGLASIYLRYTIPIYQTYATHQRREYQQGTQQFAILHKPWSGFQFNRY